MFTIDRAVSYGISPEVAMLIHGSWYFGQGRLGS